MKVLVVGGSGYTGGELLRLLVNHPKVDELDATSRNYCKEPISDIHPNLKGIIDKKFLEFNVGKIDADMIFLALPHGQSMDYVPKILEKGIKVVDLSADYRMRDVEVYEKYYVKHKTPELLERAVYGLPELFRDQIKGCDLVANPGCYTTAAILSIYPLEKYKSTLDFRVIIDAKSGTSGAGVKPNEFLHHCEVDGNLKPYKVIGHRHQPEMELILKQFIPGISISFTPMLVPTTRGILSNAYVFGDLEVVDLKKHYEDTYSKDKFVRVVDIAYTKNVIYSNYCDISVHYDPEKKRIVLISAIDNLVKGAAGQAIQNMNLVLGYPEDEGLNVVGPHP
jgi:N-acetyl-gamma-glutamyl-phosphate reductase